MPPYYNKKFFEQIKFVIEKTPLNPTQMTLKMWYRHLLEMEVTMNVIDDEGRMEPKRSRVEELFNDNDWDMTNKFAMIKGLSAPNKSFVFKLVQQLLPLRSGLITITPDTNAACILCNSQSNETAQHCFLCAIKIKKQEL